MRELVATAAREQREKEERNESNKVQQKRITRFELLDGSGETIGANLKVPEERHKRPITRLEGLEVPGAKLLYPGELLASRFPRGC